MNIIEEIKERVTCKDVCNMYGIPINSSGFTCCINHQEKTPSMKIYDGKDGFYCFGCGCSGDVLSFVKILFDLNFQQTIEKINDDFNLKLPINQKMTYSEKLAFAKQDYLRKKEKEKKKENLKIAELEYWKAFDRVVMLEKWLEKYQPKDINEELNPCYLVALSGIEKARYLLSIAEVKYNECSRSCFD